MNVIEIEVEVDSKSLAEFQPSNWMRYCLWVAAFTHLVWGAMAIFFPTTMLQWHVAQVNSLAIALWQSIGCFATMMGLGYLFSSRNAFRQNLFLSLAVFQHAVVFLGSFALVCSGRLPTGFLWSSFGLAVWAVPCGLILWKSTRSLHAFGSAHLEPEADQPLLDLRTNTGELLDELADKKPQLVVFLRHAGCTFCRQALADIQASRKQIEEAGCGIVLVHLGSEQDAQSLDVFARYNVDDLPRISDPTSRLYRQFGLDLGGFTALFGLKVWLRSFLFGVVNGHGIGAIRGNSFQMPGAYLYHCGMILSGFRHETAADRPDYVALARQVAINSETSRSPIAADF